MLEETLKLDVVAWVCILSSSGLVWSAAAYLLVFPDIGFMRAAMVFRLMTFAAQFCFGVQVFRIHFPCKCQQFR